MLNVDLHQRSDTPDRLLAIFEEAHTSDKWAEGRARLFLGLGLAGLIGGVIIGVVGAGTEALAIAAAGGALVVGGIVCLIVRARYKRYDLEDRKLATVTQFLKIVAADSPQTAPINVAIDFRSYLKATSPAESSGGWGEPKLKRYQHSWLHLAGSLLDGNRYDLEVTDHISRKEKPKRKYTKVKERIGSRICLGLRLHSRYGAAEGVAGALVKLPPPAGLTATAVRGRGRALSVVLACTPTVSTTSRAGRHVSGPGLEVTGNTLLGALLWCYEGLALGAQRPASAA
jgi:hypothetical protein